MAMYKSAIMLPLCESLTLTEKMFVKKELFDFGALDLAVSAAKNWLDEVDERPVCAIDDVDTLRAKLYSRLQDEGLPAQEVIGELIDVTKDGLVGSAGGRFWCRRLSDKAIWHG